MKKKKETQKELNNAKSNDVNTDTKEENTFPYDFEPDKIKQDFDNIRDRNIQLSWLQGLISLAQGTLSKVHSIMDFDLKAINSCEDINSMRIITMKIEGLLRDKGFPMNYLSPEEIEILNRCLAISRFWNYKTVFHNRFHENKNREYRISIIIDWANLEKIRLETLNLQDGQQLKSYNLKWNEKFSQIDFLELCKALIESKAIDGTQKDFINAFSEMLQIDIKNPDQSLQSIKKDRNIDKETKFLDTLKESLKFWISKEK